MAANIAARSFGLLSYTDEGYNTSIFISTMRAMSICILYEPLLTGAVAAFLLNLIGKKTKKHFLTEMSFPGGMLIGMLGSYIANMFL